jgi:RNA polymerase primary sigma factor
VAVAKRYRDRGLEFGDLVQYGNVGLIRAAEKFAPEHGTKFNTYATYWVKQSILRALADCAASIRVPAYVYDWLGKWKRASATLQHESGQSPSIEEVAAFLDITGRDLITVQRALAANGLTPDTGATEEGWGLGELAVDHRSPTPDAGIEHADESRQLRGHLSSLPPLLATVLSLRYGLDGEFPLSLREIGRKLGMSKDRAGHIEDVGLKALREAIEGRESSTRKDTARHAG